jgi:PTH1 family peptidyl-tRNA hydrolase
MADNHFLIIGLGNPGKEYENTRHNIGFRVVEALAEKNGGIFESGRYANVAKIRLKNKVLTLIKPTTYMNLSGKAVAYWLKELALPHDKMLVISDDLALPEGTLRMRPKGSDAGHNGLKNIQELLQSNQFPRLRFGIGNQFAKGQQAEFVLGKFSPTEELIIVEKIQKSLLMIEIFVHEGIEKAMSKHNE